MAELVVVIVFAIAVIYGLSRTAIIVPQQQAWIVERLGRYEKTLRGGFYLLVPFVDNVRLKHNLMEIAKPIEEQDCITKDNVLIHIDGILYYKIVDPERATYGITNLEYAIEQLAQTTLRSEIGKIELDHTFEERPRINADVVAEVDKASEAWGVKVLRYEIRSIKPPVEILHAMEQQMRAEREKRAVVLESEGKRTAAINQSEGLRESLINKAEGEKQQRIKEAEGEASAITAVASATADGIRAIAQALQSPGGYEALQYRIAIDYIQQFGLLAKETNTMILPTNLADVAGVLATAMTVIKRNGADGSSLTPSALSPATPLPAR